MNIKPRPISAFSSKFKKKSFSQSITDFRFKRNKDERAPMFSHAILNVIEIN